MKIEGMHFGQEFAPEPQKPAETAGDVWGKIADEEAGRVQQEREALITSSTSFDGLLATVRQAGYPDMVIEELEKFRTSSLKAKNVEESGLKLVTPADGLQETARTLMAHELVLQEQKHQDLDRVMARGSFVKVSVQPKDGSAGKQFEAQLANDIREGALALLEMQDGQVAQPEVKSVSIDGDTVRIESKNSIYTLQNVFRSRERLAA